MAPVESNESSAARLSRTVNLLVQLAVLVFILGWCYRILAPFIPLLIWGIIIAVTMFPLTNRLARMLKKKGLGLASTIVATVLLLLLIIPSLFLADSLTRGVRNVRATLQQDELVIPPPGEKTKEWPAFTKPLVDLWEEAADDLQDFVIDHGPQLKAAGRFVLNLIATTGLGILEFVVSIIIAGIMMAHAKAGGDTFRQLFNKLSPENGDELMAMSESTIRSVVKGILGVALIQTLLAGIGLIAAGVPVAGLWIFFCLIFSIIQIGVAPVMIPVIIYLFSVADTTTATLFTVWAVMVMLSDNFLKPILLGRGAAVPMLIVFLGAIGGFLATGLVGLFLGAVILSLGYKLFMSWLRGVESRPETLPSNPPPSTLTSL